MAVNIFESICIFISQTRDSYEVKSKLNERLLIQYNETLVLFVVIIGKSICQKCMNGDLTRHVQYQAQKIRSGKATLMNILWNYKSKWPGLQRKYVLPTLKCTTHTHCAVLCDKIGKSVLPCVL